MAKRIEYITACNALALKETDCIKSIPLCIRRQFAPHPCTFQSQHLSVNHQQGSPLQPTKSMFTIERQKITRRATK